MEDNTELRRIYEEMLTTLTTPGWKHIVDNYQEAYEQQNNLTVINSEENLFKAQGRLTALHQIINLRENVEGLLDDLNASEREGEEDNIDDGGEFD